jgi:hypothetical protein
MTQAEWTGALNGKGERVAIIDGDYIRARDLVANAISAYARTIVKNRPDKAGVLRRIASAVSAGNLPAKGLMKKAHKDIEAARKQTVDGIALVYE